jgi:hypothetical protein
VAQSRIWLAGALTVCLLGFAGCSAGSPQPTASGGSAGGTGTPGTTGATPAAAESSNSLADGGRIVALAKGPDGAVGLWELDGKSGWAFLGAEPAATALGWTPNGIAIASGHAVELRGAKALGSAGASKPLTWPASHSAAPIVSLDSSADGKMAVVCADDQSLTYDVAPADGTIATLTPSPKVSLKPSAVWLDESRLLVLDTDPSDISRLAVVDTAAGTMKSSMAVNGVRWMGVSSDRQTVALATGSAVYAGSVATLTSDAAVAPMLTLDGTQTVWGLVLSADGSEVFMLSGSVAGISDIQAVHEFGYARSASGWAKILDSTVPFGWALGQVYLA